MRTAVRSEINVTPFIDVMLVLLIIFMVAAPLATTSLRVNLPPPSDVFQPPPPAMFVSLQEDGKIFVGSQKLGERQGDWQSLGGLLRLVSNADTKMPVFVRADRDVPYADVIRLIDALRAAGYTNVSIVAEGPGT